MHISEIKAPLEEIASNYYELNYAYQIPVKYYEWNTKEFQGALRSHFYDETITAFYHENYERVIVFNENAARYVSQVLYLHPLAGRVSRRKKYKIGAEVYCKSIRHGFYLAKGVVIGFTKNDNGEIVSVKMDYDGLIYQFHNECLYNGVK